MTIARLASAPLILSEASWGARGPDAPPAVRARPARGRVDRAADRRRGRRGRARARRPRARRHDRRARHAAPPRAAQRLGWVPFAEPIYDTFAFTGAAARSCRRRRASSWPSPSGAWTRSRSSCARTAAPPRRRRAGPPAVSPAAAPRSPAQPPQRRGRPGAATGRAARHPAHGRLPVQVAAVALDGASDPRGERPRRAPPRVAAAVPGGHLRLLVVVQRRRDLARVDGRQRHAGAGELVAQRLGEHPLGGLRRRVRRRAGEGAQPGAGGHHDDVAAAARQQVRAARP